MRPRVFPAEDSVFTRLSTRSLLASMRPRVFPAEDMVSHPRFLWAGFRFNEAAGIPRGRRLRVVVVEVLDPASMRPRVFPAEDPGRDAGCGCRRLGFNEGRGYSPRKT